MKVKIIGGKVVWQSANHREAFMKQAEGKWVDLKIEDTSSDELLKYFEGCLVPVFYFLHPHSKWKNYGDARNALKLEFLPPKYYESEKGTVRILPSRSELNKEKMQRFVDAVTIYMIDSMGIDPTVIDCESYKAWRDMSTDDPVYPPLRRLKDEYEKAQNKITPDEMWERHGNQSE